jgi:hypothetical protein
MVTYVSILILVGTEFYGVALAAAWAMAAFFGLGDTVTYGLYVLGAAAATYGIFLFARGIYGVDARLDAEQGKASRAE